MSPRNQHRMVPYKYECVYIVLHFIENHKLSIQEVARICQNRWSFLFHNNENSINYIKSLHTHYPSLFIREPGYIIKYKEISPYDHLAYDCLINFITAIENNANDPLHRMTLEANTNIDQIEVYVPPRRFLYHRLVNPDGTYRLRRNTTTNLLSSDTEDNSDSDGESVFNIISIESDLPQITPTPMEKDYNPMNYYEGEEEYGSDADSGEEEESCCPACTNCIKPDLDHHITFDSCGHSLHKWCFQKWVVKSGVNLDKLQRCILCQNIIQFDGDNKMFFDIIKHMYQFIEQK